MPLTAPDQRPLVPMAGLVVRISFPLHRADGAQLSAFLWLAAMYFAFARRVGPESCGCILPVVS